MRPRMQLSPGDYVTAAFRAEMDAWLADFFGYEDDAPVMPAMPTSTISVARKVAKPRKSVGRSKTQVEPDTQSFTAMLEGIADSFGSMRVPTINGSWLERRNVAALKKLGIYVPPYDYKPEQVDAPAMPAGHKLPSIAACLLCRTSQEPDKNHCYPRFKFAIKEPSLPSSVEQIRGAAYRYGMNYITYRGDKGEVLDEPRGIWVYCWVVVTPSGQIRMPMELVQEVRRITHRRRQGNGSRQDDYSARTWSVPRIATPDEASYTQDIDEYRRHLLCAFRSLLMWWAARESQWSVGVRKDGHRVTFSIDPKHTAAYFADRDTAVNVDGKPRKIIHFVRAHTRSNGAEVKAHVRGLSHFNWKGYECSVTAPGLRGIVATTCDIEPSEVPTKELKEQPGRYVELDSFAQMMAQSEEAAA